MDLLVAAIPLEAHDDPKTKTAIRSAVKSAKRFRRTSDENTASKAEHDAKFKQMIALMQEVHSLPSGAKT